MAPIGTWPEGECCLRWVEPRSGRRLATGGYEPFQADVFAELKRVDARHWVVRQIKKRRDTGHAVEAAAEDELRPLREERSRWTHELHQRGVAYGLDEFDTDPLGRYEARYGSLPDQPLETWDDRFLGQCERIERDSFEIEWNAARAALAKGQPRQDV